jgi:AraC-like DNA-binding protein
VITTSAYREPVSATSEGAGTPAPAGTSEGAQGTPHPRLRPYVGSYHGYLLRGFPPGVHIGMPSTTLTVIVTVDEPIELPVSPHPGQPGGHWNALASGLTTRPALIAHRGYQHGVQLALTPLGSRALFGMPAAELGSWLVDLTDLLGPRAVELRERLAATADWSRRFAVLDEILLRRVDDVELDANLRHAWRLLTDPARRRPVTRVADEIGWSRRNLAIRFGSEFGITPKDADRLTRFERSHRLLRRPGVTVAGVAAAAGYYDQAHMSRDWRDMAGLPPSQWLAREVFPFVQDPGTDPMEG